MSAEIITYWNGEELSYVLNAISALINSTDFNSLLKIVSYLGVMIVFMMGVLGQMKQEDWPKYVAALAVFVFVMTGPKETVTITDKSITMPSTVVGNVPMPLAWIGSTTSGIGSWLTDSVETVFQVLPPLFSGHTPYPPELSFTGGGGPLFGHRIIQESGMMSINTPILSQDMMEFYRECVIPDINTGYLDVNQLNKSANIWAMLNDTNPARYVTIHNYNAGTGKWAWDTSAINCQQAYTRLTVYLNSEAAANLKQLGRRMNYKSTQAAAEALIVGQLQNGYGAMLGISANAVDIVQQKMMTNFIREASYKIPAMSGDPSSTQIGLAQAQAEAQYASSSLTMRKVAEGLLPKVRNVIEALIYALFPILIIYVIMAGHNALKPFAMYLKLAIWIQLWPMLYAILNFFITFGAAKQWQAQTLGDGLAMQYSALINAGAASDMAVAGMMVSSIPAIAWMLASGSVYAATQVANGMMAPANSAASSAGSQAALGNISMGNTNLRTANADKYDMTPSINTGTMSMRGSSGYKHNFSDTGSFVDGSFNQTTGLKTDVSGSMQKMEAAKQSYSTAQKATLTAQESFNKAIGSSAGTSYDFASNASNMQTFTKGMGKDESNEFAKGAQSYESSVKSIAKSLGIDDAQAKELMGSAGFGWNNSWLPGLEAKVNSSAKYSQQQKADFKEAISGDNGKKLDEAARWAEKVNQNSGWNNLVQHGDTASKKIASGVLESRQKLSALTAAKANEASAAQALEQTVQSAVSATTNMGDTVGIVAEQARKQWLRNNPNDYAGAERASVNAAKSFILSQGGNPKSYFDAGATVLPSHNQAITTPERSINTAHRNNTGEVEAAGDPTALALNAQALYQKTLKEAQAKVQTGMDQLTKDVKGMSQRVESFRAETGKDMDAQQTEALKAAESKGLISFDEKTGKYTINDPNMSKNIDKAANEISELSNGRVSAESVKNVVGTLAAARTGAVLSGSAVKAIVGAGESAAPVISSAAGGVLGTGVAGATLSGAGATKAENKAPSADTSSLTTSHASALPASSTVGAMTASDSNNRPDVSQHQATGQTSLNTPTPQPTEATAAPQAAAKPVPVDKEPVTQGTEAKTTSTTPATDRVQPSTGMANASPDQSSQVMMSASDSTNRPDVNHNQSANDRGAQAEVRTVETQTQTNTVETQHHTRTVTQQTGDSSQPKSAPKVGNDNPKDAKPSDRGDKPDVS